MKVYLDLCCFNRPYDDQTQMRIRMESEAKIAIQEKIRQKECMLVWSAVLDVENSYNPYFEHRLAIAQWKGLATNHVEINEDLLKMADKIKTMGIGSFDALHVASSIYAKTDIFLTTDDRLLKKLKSFGEILALLPADALAKLENWYEN